MKMFEFRKLIIFCLLIVSFQPCWLLPTDSTPPASAAGPSGSKPPDSAVDLSGSTSSDSAEDYSESETSDYDDGFDLPLSERFELFVCCLEDGIEAGVADFNVSLDLDALSDLVLTSETFQETCIEEFEWRLIEEEIDYFSEEETLLGELAFEALDFSCKDMIEFYQSECRDDELISKQLNEILYEGDIIDFLIFCDDPDIDDDVFDQEIKKLKELTPGMDDVEAEIRIFVKKYNMGKILEDYPSPSSPVGESSSKPSSSKPSSSKMSEIKKRKKRAADADSKTKKNKDSGVKDDKQETPDDLSHSMGKITLKK